MTMLRAPLAVFTFGCIALLGANRAHTQTVSLQTELLRDWSS
jgi:hypothetical protein